MPPGAQGKERKRGKERERESVTLRELRGKERKREKELGGKKERKRKKERNVVRSRKVKKRGSNVGCLCWLVLCGHHTTADSKKKVVDSALFW